MANSTRNLGPGREREPEKQTPLAHDPDPAWPAAVVFFKVLHPGPGLAARARASGCDAAVALAGAARPPPRPAARGGPGGGAAATGR